MTVATAYESTQRRLNQHCADCEQCRSADQGICVEADRLLDELLNASLPRESDDVLR
jgi:hypothetical protein